MALLPGRGLALATSRMLNPSGPNVNPGGSVPSDVVLGCKLLGPQSLVRRTAAFGKAHPDPVFGDELDPGLLKSLSHRAHVRSSNRDWPIVGFGLSNGGEANPAAFRQGFCAPPDQSARSAKLAAGDRHELA